MKQKILTGVSMVAAVLLWVGPWSLFATCPVGETIMKCHWCCVALIPIAIILLVLGALQLLAKQEESRKLLAIASIAAFICAILLPATLIGGCANPEMSCNVLTYPCVYAISVVGIIVQAINAFTKNSQR